MKIQIKERRGGKIKTMDKRFADILVKTKRATYHSEAEMSNGNTYQTRMMVAAPPGSNLPPLPQNPPLATPPQNVDNSAGQDRPKKKKGRRPRTNTQ